MTYDDTPRSARSGRRAPISASRQPSRRIPNSAGNASQHQRLRGRSQGPSLGRRPSINIGGQRYDAARLGILAAAVVLLILLIVLLGSCIRSCSAKPAVSAESATTAAVSASDNISSAMATRLQERLDQDAYMKTIAENTSKYSDEALIELALDEPLAVEFVAKLPDADKSVKTYDDSVTQGTVPQLYNWDSRWGYSSYAGLPLGLTGSGPTSFSMAYMALTGKGDKTPADMATLATNGGFATGDAYTSADFFSKVASQVGLYTEVVNPSADEITGSLKNAHPVICLVNANTFTSRAHYVICASINDSGMVNVYDPTSSMVTTHAWPASMIASFSSNMFVMHPASDNPEAKTASTTAATTGTTGTTANDTTAKSTAAASTTAAKSTAATTKSS